MPSATAAILSIGDELTLGQNVDTNSAWLSQQLATMNVRVIEHRTVADDRKAIASAVKELGALVDVLILSGGLGPTDDDLTREALGDVLTPGEELETDPVLVKFLKRLFESRGRVMPPGNVKQAMRPRSMRSLSNHNGTAPGLAGTLASEGHSCLIFSLPGPPREMQPMFDKYIAPALREAGLVNDDHVLLTAAVHEIGMGESHAAQRLGDLMDRGRNPLLGTTVSDSIVTARIRAEGPRNWAVEEIEKTMAMVMERWQPYCFGRKDVTLAQSVGDLLRQSNQTLAVAESCTGGWLGKMIVDVPRSSDYFSGGWITYSNEMKTRCIDVPAELIAKHGAVSSQVAQAMARGALRRAGSDFALAITGVAGPDGGSADKPVGTVHIGLAQLKAGAVQESSRHFLFTGDRTMIRDRSAKCALQMLRLALVGAEDVPLLWEMTENANKPKSQHADIGAQVVR